MALPSISPPAINQQQLTQTTSAALLVTRYAQAIVTVIPTPTGLPDWYAPISADITTAQTHAQGWLDTLCPAVSTTVPGTIISFNAAFQTASAGILAVLQQISQQPAGLPSPAQQQAVNTFLTGIQAAASEQKNTVDGIVQQVNAFAAATNADQNRIAADLNVVATHITAAAGSIDQLQAIISESFLDGQDLGPCNVIVMINVQVSLKISGLNPDPTVISTVYAQAMLQNLLGNVQAAQTPLQLVLDGWSIMENKFAAVLTDLADASADELVPALQTLDFEAAQLQWQQLADFAATLVPSAT